MAKMTLWLLALLIMISAIIYQRTTGPTYPFRGTIEASGIEYSYRLLRSQETVSGAKISLPDVKAEYCDIKIQSLVGSLFRIFS